MTTNEQSPADILAALRREHAATIERERALKASIEALESAYPATARQGYFIGQNEFSNMDVVDAVVKYLTLRNERRAIPRQEVLRDLEKGGCDLGKDPVRHGRVLKVSIRMNSKKSTHPLVYNDKDDTVELRHPAKAVRSA